jgi:hypothetical protein
MLIINLKFVSENHTVILVFRKHENEFSGQWGTYAMACYVVSRPTGKNDKSLQFLLMKTIYTSRLWITHLPLLQLRQCNMFRLATPRHWMYRYRSTGSLQSKQPALIMLRNHVSMKRKRFRRPWLNKVLPRLSIGATEENYENMLGQLVSWHRNEQRTVRMYTPIITCVPVWRRDRIPPPWPCES